MLRSGPDGLHQSDPARGTRHAARRLLYGDEGAGVHRRPLLHSGVGPRHRRQELPAQVAGVLRPGSRVGVQLGRTETHHPRKGSGGTRVVVVVTL